jgi:hypothetical protein
MSQSDFVLLFGVLNLVLGSFLLGFVIGEMPRGERRKGRHAKGRGRHTS